MMEQAAPAPSHHKFRCAGFEKGGCAHTSEKWGTMTQHMSGCSAAQSTTLKMRKLNNCMIKGYVKVKRDTYRCAGNPEGGCTFTCNDKKEIQTHMDRCKAAIGKPRKLKWCLNKDGNDKRKQSDDGSAEHQDAKK